MPERTIHCRLCGTAIKGYDFEERMAKLRHHRRKKHPTVHKRSVKKAQATRYASSPAKMAWITRKKRYGKSGRK